MPRRRRKISSGVSSRVARIILFLIAVPIFICWASQNEYGPLILGLIALMAVLSVVADVLLALRRKREQEEQRAEAEARQLQIANAWQRAMAELYPNRDVNTFPSYSRLLDSRKLEVLARNVYAKLGYQAEHVGGAGDGGVDVWLDRLGKKEIVQCKQYQVPVQPDTVRSVYGAAMGRGAKMAYLWAPGGFTDAARSEARHFIQIELVDEQGILELVEKAYAVPT